MAASATDAIDLESRGAQFTFGRETALNGVFAITYPLQRIEY
jgi:hypothetical protein